MDKRVIYAALAVGSFILIAGGAGIFLMNKSDNPTGTISNNTPDTQTSGNSPMQRNRNASQINGEVISINGENEFILNSEDGQTIVEWDDSTTFAQTSTVDLTELKADQFVTVAYTLNDNKYIASTLTISDQEQMPGSGMPADRGALPDGAATAERMAGDGNIPPQGEGGQFNSGFRPDNMRGDTSDGTMPLRGTISSVSESTLTLKTMEANESKDIEIDISKASFFRREPATKDIIVAGNNLNIRGTKSNTTVKAISIELVATIQ